MKKTGYEVAEVAVGFSVTIPTVKYGGVELGLWPKLSFPEGASEEERTEAYRQEFALVRQAIREEAETINHGANWVAMADPAKPIIVSCHPDQVTLQASGVLAVYVRQEEEKIDGDGDSDV